MSKVFEVRIFLHYQITTKIKKFTFTWIREENGDLKYHLHIVFENQ